MTVQVGVVELLKKQEDTRNEDEGGVNVVTERDEFTEEMGGNDNIIS